MNETINTINNLRTIHGSFSEKQINDSDLDIILESSIKAANASARQSYSIIVIENKNDMKDLFGYKGSKALIYCVDFNRIKTTARHMGHDFDNDDIIGFITGTIDTVLACQTAVIAAKSIGIDSLITNGLHRKNLNKVYKKLNLPEKSCFPLITVVLGYPQKEPVHNKGRLNKEFIVHRGTYKNLDNNSLDKIIEEYDDKQKHIGLINDWEKLGFKHYLDWFYTKWSGIPIGKKIVDGKIKEFQDRIINSGFWWI